MVARRAGFWPPGDGAAGWRPAVVAVPANNEGERIGDCLAALAMQRDGCGAPLPEGTFAVLVLANNCVDGTAGAVRTWAAASPHPVMVVEEQLPADRANAGWARKRAMDLAADHLASAGREDGVLLTTDADSCVAPTWVSAIMAAFDLGADAVAGYVDGHAPEIVGLGRDFLRRGRLEDRYLRAVAEIEALCDPQAHDPWPNHRVSSGASLAVTLEAYRAIGGLPPRPVGEDAALTQALAEAGFLVRHSLDVCVSTSCRLEGRASGGAADTMRHRRDVADAPCDPDIVPARLVLRRAVLRRRLRQSFGDPGRTLSILTRRLGSETDAVGLVETMARTATFARFWRVLAEQSAVTPACGALRPSDLPRQIDRADAILRRLRRLGLNPAAGGPDGKSAHSGQRATTPA